MSEMANGWVPLAAAIEAICGRFESLDSARQAVLNSLADGALSSRCSRSGYVFREIEKNTSTSIPLGPSNLMPVEFWQECVHPAAYKSFDWQTGSFQFDGQRQGVSRTFRGSANGVQLNLVAIKHLFSSSHSARQLPEASTPRGRKPSSWWRDFSEELAVYIFECGLPEGRSAEGQSKVIDEVFGRLAQQGKTEPSRTQVQGVVSSVLRRCRSAEKE